MAMTRQQLEALGLTDAELDAFMLEHFGQHSHLADDPDDREWTQVQRHGAWEDFEKAKRPAYLGTARRIGAYGDTDADVHREQASED